MMFHHEPDIYLETKWHRGNLLVMGPVGRMRLLIEKANRTERIWGMVEYFVFFRWLWRAQ
jgi:hypothetical protein